MFAAATNLRSRTPAMIASAITPAPTTPSVDPCRGLICGLYEAELPEAVEDPDEEADRDENRDHHRERDEVRLSLGPADRARDNPPQLGRRRNARGGLRVERDAQGSCEPCSLLLRRVIALQSEEAATAGVQEKETRLRDGHAEIHHDRTCHAGDIAP